MLMKDFLIRVWRNWEKKKKRNIRDVCETNKYSNSQKFLTRIILFDHQNVSLKVYNMYCILQDTAS